jgi:outer membrane protein assembly factor BamB
LLLAMCGGDDSRATGDAGQGPGGGSGESQGASVLQFHNHVNRDGLFVDSAITKSSAAKFHRDMTFDGTVAGNVYASPLYVEKGPGGRGAFYVATEDNHVYALDESTGKSVWDTSLGTSAPQSGAGCGNINPIGVTGTPAIDLASRLLVLDAAIGDPAGTRIQAHKAYGLSLDDGSQKWVLDLSTVHGPSGETFDPTPQNQRSAVLIVGGVAYIVFGGHSGDCGAYHGWVFGIPLDNPAGALGWRTDAQGAGIWGPGGASSDGTSVYVTTGNATSSSASWSQSEGVFRLDPGPRFAQTSFDCFAPANWQPLDGSDTDISGSGPLVIDAPAMTPSTLLLAQGKDGNLYLLDRANLGGVGATPLGTLHVMNGGISNAGAWATVPSGTFVVVRPNGGSGAACPPGTSGDLVATKLDPAAPAKMTIAWCADSGGGGSPIITTSDGQNDALVWVVGAEGSTQLRAFDLTSGAVVFGGGSSSDALPGVRHFSTPLAAHGRIVTAGDDKVYVLTP